MLDFVFPRVKTIDWAVEVVLASSNKEKIMKPLVMNSSGLQVQVSQWAKMEKIMQ